MTYEPQEYDNFSEIPVDFYEYLDLSDSSEFKGRWLEDEVEEIRQSRWQRRGQLSSEESVAVAKAACEDMVVFNDHCGDMAGAWFDEDGVAAADAALHNYWKSAAELANALAARMLMVASVVREDRPLDGLDQELRIVRDAGPPGQAIASSPMLSTGPPLKAAAPSNEAQSVLIAA